LIEIADRQNKPRQRSPKGYEIPVPKRSEGDVREDFSRVFSY
jgi:hypothetical protein